MNTPTKHRASTRSRLMAAVGSSTIALLSIFVVVGCDEPLDDERELLEELDRGSSAACPVRLHQGALHGQGHFQYGHASIPDLSVVDLPSDLDRSRWGMVHDKNWKDAGQYHVFFMSYDGTGVHEFEWSGESYAPVKRWSIDYGGKKGRFDLAGASFAVSSSKEKDFLELWVRDKEGYVWRFFGDGSTFKMHASPKYSFEDYGGSDFEAGWAVAGGNGHDVFAYAWKKGQLHQGVPVLRKWRMKDGKGTWIEDIEVRSFPEGASFEFGVLHDGDVERLYRRDL